MSTGYIRNSLPGAFEDADSTFVKARWFNDASVAAVPHALLLQLAASTEIPLSDSVGLDESLCS